MEIIIVVVVVVVVVVVFFGTYQFSADSMITRIAWMFFVDYLYDCVKMKKVVDRRRLFFVRMAIA